ncbi:MAG: helix-turn-helix domain-containing protein [Nocardioides sp.]
MTTPTTKNVAYRWHLRNVMSEHGLHNTTALVPLLADRGVVMTSTQVYRIVTGEPERLNMRLLCALCDIFGCTPNDLIEPYVVATSGRGRKCEAAAASAGHRDPASKNRPRRATIASTEDS